MFNNPNAINSVYQLAARSNLKTYEDITPHQASIIREMPPEVSRDLHPSENKIRTMHVLKDGSDSVGVALASLRVYVNIGLFTVDDENLLKLGVAQKTYRDALEDGNYDDSERGAVYQRLGAVRNMFASALEHRVPYDIQGARRSRDSARSRIPGCLIAVAAGGGEQVSEELLDADRRTDAGPGGVSYPRQRRRAASRRQRAPRRARRPGRSVD